MTNLEQNTLQLAFNLQVMAASLWAAGGIAAQAPAEQDEMLLEWASAMINAGVVAEA